MCDDKHEGLWEAIYSLEKKINAMRKLIATARAATDDTVGRLRGRLNDLDNMVLRNEVAIRRLQERNDE